MKKLILFCLALLLMASCGPEPKPIDYGHDNCHYCKMTIVDKQHAAEAVTDKGKVYKFDAIECLVPFVQEKGEDSFSFLLVNDYHNPGKLIAAKSSSYLISKSIPSPMGAYLSAFSSESSMASFVTNPDNDQTYSWELLKKHLDVNASYH